MAESNHSELPSAQSPNRAKLRDTPPVVSNDLITHHDLSPHREQ
jgi:hypothetical protein